MKEKEPGRGCGEPAAGPDSVAQSIELGRGHGSKRRENEHLGGGHGRGRTDTSAR